MFDRLIRRFRRSPAPWIGTSVSVVVVLATACNVALLQSGKHPAPLAFRFGPGDVNDETAPPPVIARPTQRIHVPDVASIEELITGPDIVADLQLLEIQTELQSLGFYGGPLDGLMGPRTQTAIRVFEDEAGMPVSGHATEVLLTRLRNYSVPATTADPLSPGNGVVAAEPGSDPRVLAIQRTLAEIGYAPGALDGLMGRATSDAIMAFEADRGMVPTGQLSDSLIRELEAYTGRPLV